MNYPNRQEIESLRLKLLAKRDSEIKTEDESVIVKNEESVDVFAGEESNDTTQDGQDEQSNMSTTMSEAP